MKKIRNKGITLIALVITIIILLILAGITIAQLTGSGLFENARLAKEKSDEAQNEEDVILADYEKQIGKYINEIGGSSSGETESIIEIVSLENSPSYLFAAKAIVNLTEAGSGINYNKCKYVFTKTSDKIGTDESKYTDGTLSDTSNEIEQIMKAGTWYLHILATDNEGNAEEKVSEKAITIEETKDYIYEEDKIYDVTLLKGNYKLEVWGAQGGSYDSTYVGGYGGYSTGEISLTKNETLYICVGGAGSGNGSHQTQNGGYNGGGDAIIDNDSNTRQASGGGATHIAIKNNRGELVNYEGTYQNEIVIVAGGRRRRWNECCKGKWYERLFCW